MNPQHRDYQQSSIEMYKQITNIVKRIFRNDAKQVTPLPEVQPKRGLNTVYGVARIRIVPRPVPGQLIVDDSGITIHREIKELSVVKHSACGPSCASLKARDWIVKTDQKTHPADGYTFSGYTTQAISQFGVTNADSATPATAGDDHHTSPLPEAAAPAALTSWQTAHGLSADQVAWYQAQSGKLGAEFEQEYPASPSTPPAGEPDPRFIISCDPGQRGYDDTAIVFTRAGIFERMEIHPADTVMEEAEYLTGLYREHKPDVLAIDKTGIGAAIYDALKYMGVPVVERHPLKGDAAPNKAPKETAAGMSLLHEAGKAQLKSGLARFQQDLIGHLLAEDPAPVARHRSRNQREGYYAGHKHGRHRRTSVDKAYPYPLDRKYWARFRWQSAKRAGTIAHGEFGRVENVRFISSCAAPKPNEHGMHAADALKFMVAGRQQGKTHLAHMLLRDAATTQEGAAS